MNLTSLITLISSILVVLGAFITVFIKLVNIARDYKIMSERVELMWSFQMKRGKTEALKTELIVENSPIRVTNKALVAFGQLKDLIRQWYIDNSVLLEILNNNQLALKIEQIFGQKIVEQVCKPTGLHEGACLIVAVELAKGNNIEWTDDCPPSTIL